MTTEPIQIDVWSDYVCPWCFLATTSLGKLEASHPVEISWHSYELRPNGAPFPPEYRARIEAGRPRLLAIARENYGVELKPGPLGTNSRPALIGAKYAERMGMGRAYHMAVMSAHWLNGLNIGDLEILGNIAVEAGLDREEFLAALNEEALISEVDHDIEQARAYGISGVPALIFIDKYLVSGAQPYETLTRVVEQIQDELAQEAV